MFLKFRDLIASFCNELTLVIDNYEDVFNQNKLFKAAKLYLEPKIPSSKSLEYKILKNNILSNRIRAALFWWF